MEKLELARKPTTAYNLPPPSLPKECSKKRRKHRRALFSSTRTKHLIIIMRPFEPAESDFFCGFDNLSTDVPSDFFCGFSDKEISRAEIEMTLHPAYGQNLDFEFERKVYSVGLEKHSSHEHLLSVKPITKRNVRVLSVFDGIATGLHVLDVELNLNVEQYFSSEIDKHALQLQSDRWHGKIIQIGDVRSISEESLCALGRIDLLIGGSPCNELSLVNWRRKGALECDPITICASSFLPMVRSRNFWGNVPGMSDLSTSREETTSMHLQDVLRPKRFANFECAKTLTSNKSNMKKVELLMGLPRHFIDACDLSVKQRCNLLAKGWCVPVVRKILQPLTELYFQKSPI
ncbi:hypothetical protein FOCC_FOCC015927 [Frankliniella occidentalis]|nr:hypothetical protein FOCC_FOCC015927 [Frankliniella occidentalis]